MLEGACMDSLESIGTSPNRGQHQFMSQISEAPSCDPGALNRIAELTKENEEKTRKIEKLKKYVSNLEADGDRLNDQLLIANSYKNCFNSIVNPVFMVDQSLQINYANSAFFDMTATSPEVLRKTPKCSDILNCDVFRDTCLLKQCFEEDRIISGQKCNFVNSAERKFSLVVDAFSIKNIATNEILGGFEVFREVFEDTVRKYLLFSLSGEEYGINIKRVKEIISMIPVVTVPNLPDSILGVIDLRGQIVPVINIKKKLTIANSETSTKSCMIITEATVNNESKNFAFVADRVNDILNLNAKDIEPAPSILANLKTDYIYGIAKVKNDTKILIDFDRLVSTDEHIM